MQSSLLWATDNDAHNKNFATKFAFWDWLFGTAIFPADRMPTGYGVSGEEFPNNYFKQHLYALHRFEDVEDQHCISPFLG